MIYSQVDDFQGFRCICGDMVVAMHQECKGLLTAEELERFNERGFTR